MPVYDRFRTSYVSDIVRPFKCGGFLVVPDGYNVRGNTVIPIHLVSDQYNMSSKSFPSAVSKVFRRSNDETIKVIIGKNTTGENELWIHPRFAILREGNKLTLLYMILDANSSSAFIGHNAGRGAIFLSSAFVFNKSIWCTNIKQSFEHWHKAAYLDYPIIFEESLDHYIYRVPPPPVEYKEEIKQFLKDISKERESFKSAVDNCLSDFRNEFLGVSS